MRLLWWLSALPELSTRMRVQQLEMSSVSAADKDKSTIKTPPAATKEGVILIAKRIAPRVNV